MNKILRSLLKFSSKERIRIQRDVDLITQGNVESLNIKKLKGFTDLYRTRRGKARIIFKMNEREIRIVKIDRRNDNTYKDL